MADKLIVIYQRRRAPVTGKPLCRFSIAASWFDGDGYIEAETEEERENLVDVFEAVHELYERLRPEGPDAEPEATAEREITKA